MTPAPIGKSTPPKASPKEAPQQSTPAVNPLIYQMVIQATFLPVLLRGQHLDIHGSEHIPPAGTPLILASNHRSALDPFLLARALPAHTGRHLQFMAKQELFVPIIGDIIRAGGSFPVDRDGKDIGAIRTALRILQAGDTLGIFPEGSRHSEDNSLHGGVAMLAIKGRAPVIPAGICKVGKRWLIRLGEPLEPSLGSRQLITALEGRIQELSKPHEQRWH